MICGTQSTTHLENTLRGSRNNRLRHFTCKTTAASTRSVPFRRKARLPPAAVSSAVFVTTRRPQSHAVPNRNRPATRKTWMLGACETGCAECTASIPCTARKPSRECAQSTFRNSPLRIRTSNRRLKRLRYGMRGTTACPSTTSYRTRSDWAWRADSTARRWIIDRPPSLQQ